MGLLTNIHAILLAPDVLVGFAFNAFVGTVAFIAAIHCQYNKTRFGYIKKYLLVFLAVNFIARCFLSLISPLDVPAGVILNIISVSSAMMLVLGAIFNVFSKHVSEKVVQKYRQKE